MNIKAQKYINSGIRWTAWETIIRISCNLINMVVLTRLLSPSEFGLFALLMPMTTILGAFTDFGLSTAVVQKMNLSDNESSSIYWLQLSAAVFGSTLLAILAPSISSIFGHKILSPILWVLLVGVVIRTSGSVIGERLHREFKFSTISKIFIFSSVLSVLVSITFALNGLGVWSIVASSLTNSIITASGLWLAATWRPNFHFSFREVLSLLPFGFSVLLSSSLQKINELSYSSILGMSYGVSDLGIFSRSRSFSNHSLNAIEAITRRVTLPLFSSLQKDNSSVLASFRPILRLTLFLVTPVMTMIGVFSEPAVSFIFGEKWISAAQFVPIFSILSITNCMKSSLTSVIVSLGYPSRLLFLNSSFVIFGLLGLLITMSWGLAAVACSLTAACILHLILLFFVVNRLINYRLAMIIRDLFPAFICSFVMALSMFFVSSLSVATAAFNPFVQFTFGGIIYVSLSFIFMRSSLRYLMSASKFRYLGN